MTDIVYSSGDASERLGRLAGAPWTLPRAAWWAVLKRTWAEASNDNITLVSAGVAFYTFLSLLPLLGSVVLIYGLVSDRAEVIEDVRQIAGVLPVEIAAFIGEQLMYVVYSSEGTKGLGLLVALGLALFSARAAAGAIVSALNIAYEEDEKRSFIKVNLISLAITVSAVAIAAIGLLSVTALGLLRELMPAASPGFVLLGKVFGYIVVATAVGGVAAALFRFGPSRRHAEWKWIAPGALLFAVGWLALTLGFGFYVANLGKFTATYGSLAAVVIFLTWIYLSSYILLLGAELNCELEHQTARDSTVGGEEKPLGTRGAWAADHVAAPATVD